MKDTSDLRAADQEAGSPVEKPRDPASEARWAESFAMRRRMRLQALSLLFVALLVLATALSVPFVLHYLQIKIP